MNYNSCISFEAVPQNPHICGFCGKTQQQHSQQGTPSMAKDRRGILRGSCVNCTDCSVYELPAQGNPCDYCGCAPFQHPAPISKNKAATKNGSVSTVSKKCLICPNPVSLRPDGSPHDFCCKTHANQYSQNQGSSLGIGNFVNNFVGKIIPPSPKTCKYSGCAKPVYIESGQVYDFCGMTHAKMFAAGH